MMQQPYWQHGGDGHPLAHLILLILLVLLLVAAALYLYRLVTTRRAGPGQFVPATAGPMDEALGIARLRYARGEIKRAEYLRMSRDFGAPADDPAAPAADAAEAPTLADEPAAPAEPDTEPT